MLTFTLLLTVGAFLHLGFLLLWTGEGLTNINCYITRSRSQILPLGNTEKPQICQPQPGATDHDKH